MAATFHLARIAVIGWALLTAASAHAQSPNEARLAQGRELAQRLCSNCHGVNPGTLSPQASVPSFAKIAAKPDQSAERIAGAIVVPHPEMPTIQLTMTEIRALATYILSMR